MLRYTTVRKQPWRASVPWYTYNQHQRRPTTTTTITMKVMTRTQISVLILLGLCSFQLLLRWPSLLRIYFTSGSRNDPSAIAHTSTDASTDTQTHTTGNETNHGTSSKTKTESTHEALIEQPAVSEPIITMSRYCESMNQIITNAGVYPPSYFSFPALLQEIQPIILNATFQYILKRVWGRRARLSPEHQTSLYQGLDRLIQMFDADRLRRSLMNRMPQRTARKVMTIINQRLVDPDTYPPLRVMVFGGSVVEGVDSNLYHQGNVSLGMSIPKGINIQARFSSQLQIVLDVMIAPGVVEVTNMASGGLTSDVALPLLEHCIYPPGYPRQGPDVIISSFGFNDVHVFKEAIEMRMANEEFLDAAYRNRCDGLPAVVLVDDIFGNIKRSKERRELVNINLRHSRMVSDMARWNDVMAVSYTQAFMHYAYSDPMMEDPTGMRHYREVLFGDASSNIHPAILYHSGIAWMLAFQFLQTMVDNCQDEMVSTRRRAKGVVVGGDYDGGDELDPRLMPPYGDDDTLSDVTRKWRNRSDTFVNRCSDPNFHPGNTCSLSWIVHRSSSVSTTSDIQRLLKPLGANESHGWMAQGNPIRPPRAGWVATKANASFGIVVAATEFPIRKVTFLYMKSYGDDWMDSRVNVSLSVLGGSTTTKEDVLMETFGELEGIHNSTTSVNYKTTFDVNANVGDTVKANFVLVGGTTFKFTGMLFCAR